MLSQDVVDPVCGMTITTSQAPFTRELDGATYYLCSAACAQRFDADGAAYAAVARLQLPGWGLTQHPPAIVEQFRNEATGGTA
jgi:YHS domain-containing protein